MGLLQHQSGVHIRGMWRLLLSGKREATNEKKKSINIPPPRWWRHTASHKLHPNFFVPQQKIYFVVPHTTFSVFSIHSASVCTFYTRGIRYCLAFIYENSPQLPRPVFAMSLTLLFFAVVSWHKDVFCCLGFFVCDSCYSRRRIWWGKFPGSVQNKNCLSMELNYY
jgi:hypothetical protein